MKDDILANLNPEQRAAVQAAANGGAVLILAGAGTGKTTALISSIVKISPFPPQKILAVTFTNKAAKEMKERIFAKKKEYPYWCGTFHSVCLKILRRERQAMGARADFLVFGEDEQKKVLKSVFTEMNLSTDDYDPARWVEIISFYKDTGKRNNSEQFDAILAAYNAELARLNAVDFGDIINHTNNLLIEHPATLEKYQNLFEHIFVDEFQDTNAPQYTLLRLLAAKHKNICAVGDDDQSIYSWRGAQIKNILNFEKDFADAKIFRLTQNYRSTSHILNAANSLIKNNTGRLGKDLWSGLGDGHKVLVTNFGSDWEEASTIANVIENDTTMKRSDFAILIRNGSLSKKFEDEFIARRIPYKLTGAQKFYDRQEIQDAIAYIRLLVYRFDDMSMLRIIGRPRRGFGDVALNELKAHSKQTGKSLFESLREVSLKTKQRASADTFINTFDFDWGKMSPVNAAQKIIEDSGYFKMWQESKDDTAEDRLKNIYELINGTIAKYDSLPEFLENAALMVADDGPDDSSAGILDAVNIMTMHAAKGLEFDMVFLPAWEEGIFPNEMSVNEGGLEEERRLAYVAITRAKRRLVISNTISRMVFGDKRYNSPSRFISEIDPKFIQDNSPRYEPQPRKFNNSARKPAPQKSSMVGRLVSHAELGAGVVIEDGDEIVTVAFRDRGIKKVAKKFLSDNR